MVFNRPRPTLFKISLFGCIVMLSVLLIYFQLKSANVQILQKSSVSIDSLRQTVTVKPKQKFDNPVNNLKPPFVTRFDTEHNFPNESYFHLRLRQVSNIPNTYSIRGESVCEYENVFILIIILSVPKVADFRVRIRQTWASGIYDSQLQQRSEARLVFFFGDEELPKDNQTSLREESEKYGDIVVGHFKDSYGNLSLKMTAALTWSVNYCPQAKMVAKIDMDTFVNLPLMINFTKTVQEQQEDRRFIIGYKHMMSKPKVERGGQWAVSEKQYPNSYFPPYVYGHSYVISAPAVFVIAASFPYFPIVPNEDAFVTGVMATTLNITRLDAKSFAFLVRKPPPTFCDVAKGRFVTCLYRESNLEEIWDALSTGNCRNDSIK